MNNPNRGIFLGKEKPSTPARGVGKQKGEVAEGAVRPIEVGRDREALIGLPARRPEARPVGLARDRVLPKGGRTAAFLGRQY